ncbi:MAG: hypothetical protein ISS43_03160 [Candidatus Omnitrophica bacterium]|nr:hypothetical protein [Candidatus Omnitrophota bacterium]
MNLAVARLLILFALCSVIFIGGCAEIKPPTPEDLMREPLGASPLRIGMTKEKIKSLWGEPDVVRVLGTDLQGMVREEWIYRARYPNLPVNVDYLSETQHLFFDGDHLVRFYHRK